MGVFKRWVKSRDGAKTAYWYMRYTLNGKDKWESVGKVGHITKAVAQVEFLDEGEGTKRILSPEEELRLLEVSEPYLQNIVITALNTGMRKMEILSMKWECIDFAKGIITIPQTNTKAKKTRNIPISSVLNRTLLEQKLKIGSSEYVFPSQNPNKEHIFWIKRSFSTACKRAGINGLRFHDLRHTAATRMMESGIDIATVSKILGHSDINLTDYPIIKDVL
jgi:integrase